MPHPPNPEQITLADNFIARAQDFDSDITFVLAHHGQFVYGRLRATCGSRPIQLDIDNLDSVTMIAINERIDSHNSRKVRKDPWF